MKKLFLTSRLSGTKELLAQFLAPIKAQSVLFIPTASLTQKNTSYVDRAKEIFQSLGVDIIDFDISTLNREEAIHALAQCQVLYVSGGNSFYLLQELKRLDLIPVIQKRVEEGMVYIGESAGAIVTAPAITYIEAMDDKEKGGVLKDYSALDLVDFYTLPHYQEAPFAEAADTIMAAYKEKLSLMPINNKEAIVVCNGKVEKRTEAEETQEEKESNPLAMGIALGLSLGTGIGIVFGELMDNISLGLSLGPGIGMCIGMMIANLSRK